MIWMNGKILTDEELVIPATDQVFEHGIGLFETLRTWNGKAKLLDRHLARMTRSAENLALTLDPRDLPKTSDIKDLRDADSLHDRDIIIRITMSGGSAGIGSARVWMRSYPLRESASQLWRATIVDSPVSPCDLLSRHKTLNYWSRRLAFDSAAQAGFDEALLAMSTSSGRVILEGSRTNLFAVRGGRLVTAGVDAPILPGVFRNLVLEVAESSGIRVDTLDWRTIQLKPELLDLDAADEIFLTNSVRGIVPVLRVDGRTVAAPGSLTRQLQSLVEDWLMGDDT